MTGLILTLALSLLPTQDTLSAASSGDKRNVMLNAESSNRPREINLGIFADDYGTIVAEDGLLTSYIYHPMYSYHHWAGGNAYNGNSLMPLAESVMAYGLMGYAIESRTRFSDDAFSGIFTAASSTDLRVKFDGSASGPLGKGLSFSLGAYVNKDPTSTNPEAKRYVNDLSVLKAALAKKWGSSRLMLNYKLSHSNDFAPTSYAPFVYKGNGEVSPLGGFRFGKDNYFPLNLDIPYMSILDGSSQMRSLADMNEKLIHDIVINYTTELASGWSLEAGLHPVLTGKFDQLDLYISGIDDLGSVASHSYTLEDGTPYNGYLQTRTAAYSQSRYSDLIADLTLRGRVGKHQIAASINNMTIDRSYVLSSATFAHSAEANPVRIYRGGDLSWNYNAIAKYYAGWENTLTMHAIDEWNPTSRLNLKLGIRAAWHHKVFETASNPKGESFNNRYDGFHFKNGVVQLQHFNLNSLALGAVAQVDFRLAEKLYLTAGEIFSQSPLNMSNYFFTRTPEDVLRNSSLTTFGFDWRGKELRMTTALSYVTMNNMTNNTTTSKQIDGKSETQAYIADTALGTIGWTTDAVYTRGNFGLHLLFTLQDPRFTRFEGDVTYSDGSTEHCDFSGYRIVGMSQTLVEIDPSYNFGRCRAWLSARYYGKQYVNRVNTLYFKGHWETFGGVSYNLNSRCTLGLDCTNLLAQSGVKGVISGADTVEDESMLVGSLFAGRFIIPFTANFSVVVKL